MIDPPQVATKAVQSNMDIARLKRCSKELLDEIQKRQAELGALLDRRVQDLSSTKTDRAMLAALFTEVAMRLNDEFHIPGSEG